MVTLSLSDSHCLERGLLLQLTHSVALLHPPSVQPWESHSEESLAAAAGFLTEPNLGATES